MSFFDRLFRAFFRRPTRNEQPPAPIRVPTPPPRAPVPPPPEEVRADARPDGDELNTGPVAAPPPPPPPPPPPAPAAVGQTVAGVIRLGHVDADVAEGGWSTFVDALQAIGRVDLSQISDGFDKIVRTPLAPAAEDVMTVKHLQEALRDIGFYRGGEVDGICGYRTTSAIRLFQEYVRTMEGQAGFHPDGLFGQGSNAQLQRWLTQGLKPDWRPRPGEYDRWLNFLSGVKAKTLAHPTRVQTAVNAFNRASDTRKAEDWDFTGPGNIHLIGVRRAEYGNRFDDIFVLLMQGMVFKFQGSTEPGQSSHAKGPPYLVPGQHEYHFGWHRKSYQALRPLNQGVLIIRGGANFQLDDSDLDAGLEPNATINIHWAGKGLSRNVGSWSEGCQVITGDLYINPRGDLVDCSAFTAINNTAFNQSASATRGAYTLLSDLISTYSGEMGTNKVLYTMISETDLDLDPGIKAELTAARDAVYARST